MRARIVLMSVAATAAALLAGCGGSGESDAEGSPEVVAAFYPLAYAAERVAPSARVENLTPAGTEPHDLELSPRDVERVREAELVLYLGAGFMPALEDAVRGSENAVDLLAGETLRLGGDEEARDPHVWLDPGRYAELAGRVAETLDDPDAAAGLQAELEGLDREYRDGLSRCEHRAIVTSHAAFGYLADAYGLEQIALTGVSPAAEPSARALEALVREVERRGATTIFFETLVSPELAETVAREAGVETAVLNPLEGLTPEQVDKGADYFSVMRENLAALRDALGCR